MRKTVRIWVQENNMNRNSLISLRNALDFAEEELGLHKLSDLEKKLYYAALDSADNLGNFSSEIMRKSKWCQDIPHATYHRTLANMIKRKAFLREPGRQRNHYMNFVPFSGQFAY